MLHRGRGMMTHKHSRLSLFVGLALLASSSGATAAEEGKSFWDRFHPSADGRLRYEFDTDRFGGAGDRHRGRARFRFGGTMDVTDELSGTLRIRTGNSSDTRSPHQTFGNEFDSWEIALDRAYLRWTPSQVEGSWLEGGKIPSRFKTNPVYGELVWDADVNPEGAQAGYSHSSGDLTFGVTTGIWIFDLSASGTDSATIFPIQGHAAYKVGEALELTGALGYYGYWGIEKGTDGAIGVGSDYDIIDAILSATFTGLSVPMTLTGEISHNSDAIDDSQDFGWAVGASAKLPCGERKHRFFYQYQNIERDSVFVPLAQDDFQSLASNFKGHIAGIDWAITKRVEIRTWGLFQQQLRGGDGTWNKRLRLDLNVKF